MPVERPRVVCEHDGHHLWRIPLQLPLAIGFIIEMFRPKTENLGFNIENLNFKIESFNKFSF